jgi:hypothetical protein
MRLSLSPCGVGNPNHRELSVNDYCSRQLSGSIYVIDGIFTKQFSCLNNVLRWHLTVGTNLYCYVLQAAGCAWSIHYRMVQQYHDNKILSFQESDLTVVARRKYESAFIKRVVDGTLAWTK